MAMSRCDGCSPSMPRPSMLIDPPVIVSNPAMEFSNVDLPQPDGPTSTRKPPLSISRSMPFSTDTLPNDFSRLRISRNAMPRLSLHRAGHEAAHKIASRDDVDDQRRQRRQDRAGE